MTDATITLGDRPHPEYTHRIEAVGGALADEYHVHIHNDEYEGKLLSANVALATGEDVRDDDVDVVGEMQVEQRGERAHLWTLRVAEDYRRQGIGTYLFDLFRAYVAESGASRVSGRVKNEGDARAFLAARVPADQLDVATVDDGDNAYESVAIGAGRADPGLEVAEALERFDGFPADRLLDE